MRLRFWAFIVMGAVLVIAVIHHYNLERSIDRGRDVIVVSGVLSNQVLENKATVSDVAVDSVETVSQLSLDKKFMLEPRNVKKASQIERQILQKFSRNRQFEEMEVVCQSPICRLRGAMVVPDKARIEGLLKEIRSNANFDEAAAVPAKAIDNTVYNIADINPLRIRFTTFTEL